MPINFPPLEYSRSASHDPFFPKVESDAIPIALLKYLPDFAFISLIKKAILRVCTVVNENTRWTLEEHKEGHRRDALLRQRCHQTYTRIIDKKIA